MGLNFEGKITNKDVRDNLHIPIFIAKAINNNTDKKEEDDENRNM